MFFNSYAYKKTTIVCCKSSHAAPLAAFTPPLPLLSPTKPFNPISSASDSYLYVHELELNSKRSSPGADWTETSPSQVCSRSRTYAAATKQWWFLQLSANKAAAETHTNMHCQWQSSSHLTLMWKPNQCPLSILSSEIIRKYCFIFSVLSFLKLSRLKTYLTCSN